MDDHHMTQSIQYKTILMKAGESGARGFDASVIEHLTRGWELYGAPQMLLRPSAHTFYIRQTLIKRGPSVRSVLECVARSLFQHDTHPREDLATMSNSELLHQVGSHPSIQDFQAIVDN